MEKVVEFIIGGVLALMVLFALTPTLASEYDSASSALTDHPAAQAGLVIAFLVFFLAVAMAVYKKAI
jgi:hypothetical protein